MNGSVEPQSGELAITSAARMGSLLASLRGKPSSDWPNGAEMFCAFLATDIAPDQWNVMTLRHRLLVALGFRVAVLRDDEKAGLDEWYIANGAKIGAAFASFRDKPCVDWPPWATILAARTRKQNALERSRMFEVRYRLLIALGFRIAVLHEAPIELGGGDFAKRLMADATIRLDEAMTHFRGEPSHGLPIWVNNLCAMIAKEVVPKATRDAAITSPKAFTDGFYSGIDLSKDESMTALLSVLGQAGDEEMAAAIPAQNSRYLVGDPVERKAYLRGLMTGLETEALFESVFDRFEIEMENPKALFPRHFVMWADWPTFEKLDSPEDAFQLLNKRFAGTDRDGIVGNKASFRKFCERIGYFERSKRLK